MPRMGSFGSASWYAFKSKGRVARFKTGFWATNAALNPPATPQEIKIIFTGAAVGDFALVKLAGNTDPALAPGGWTHVLGPVATPDGGGQHSDVFCKVLDGGDIASGALFFVSATVFSGAGFAMVDIYVDATTAVAQTYTTSSGVNLILPAFTKNGLTRTLVSWIVDRDASSAPTPPTGWTQRVFTGPTGGPYMGACADLPAFAYASGAVITWTGFDASFDQAGVVLELL